MCVLVRNAAITFVLVVLAGVLPTAFSTLSAQAPVVMATGLDNPRGLAFGPDGALYVVEAGRGGTSALCLPNPVGPGVRCYGPSGAVTRIAGVGMQQRVLTGLPSVAVPTGAEATGPHDINFGFGSAFITVGSGGDPALLAPFRQAGIRLGTLLQVSLQGVITPLVDVAAYEEANNPDASHVDSNLYGLKILSNRGVMTDAGGNSLLQVNTSLGISTLAVLPERTVTGPGGVEIEMESVPTAVAEGPDGSLYVGELTGFPFPVGGARIYRVPANGGVPVVVADGFTNIIDIAVGADGSSYVLEHDVNGLLAPGDVGRLTKIGPFGSRTELAAGLLVRPGRMTIGPDNSIYVSTHSASAGLGQVVRIAQP
jgi:hypothetical protein